MRDRIELGPTPGNEDCAQVGSDGYRDRARRECQAYIRQLERTFPNAPFGACYGIRAYQHDFGTYLEVYISYDEDDASQASYAWNVEANLPGEWDATARAEIMAVV